MTRPFALAVLLAGAAWPQMPPGLRHRDSYAIRRVNPKEPCRFETEYKQIRDRKSDPRVAYVETEAIVHPDEEPIGFPGRCRAVSEQTEDGIVTWDRARGYLHLIYGDPAISDSIAWFAGTAKAPGVILCVTRQDTEWKTFVLQHKDGRWQDVTRQYLGALGLGEQDYLVVPQYGRAIRVLSFDGERFRHKRWLTWDGAKFSPLDTKDAAGWRCPDPFRYFELADRAQYCGR